MEDVEPGPASSNGTGAVLRNGLPGRAQSRRVQHVREVLARGGLIGCAAFSVVTTFMIVGVLLGESLTFFRPGEGGGADLWEFLTGGTWSPLLGSEHHFGVWPLISGTVLVAGIAAALAIPLGLITAIFLSEYAPAPLRAILKPVLEVLAGIPTVVYGFFALTIITPALQGAGRWFTQSELGAWLGSATGWWRAGDPLFEAYNATSAGIAVAIMCLPIVTSLSEDALRAVPRGLREGAYALGGTRFDVSVKVVVPAALSGVIAAFLLAIARAVGETMAVSLAAGGLANLTLNPTESVQTMTGWMVQIFLGDASNFGPEYRSAYAVAMVLFVMTFALTLIGGRVLKRFREEYE